MLSRCMFGVIVPLIPGERRGGLVQRACSPWCSSAAGLPGCYKSGLAANEHRAVKDLVAL